MKIELDQEDLVNLLCGIDIHLSLVDHPKIKLLGSYNNTTGEWDWDRFELEDCDEDELYELYKICKKARK